MINTIPKKIFTPGARWILGRLSPHHLWNRFIHHCANSGFLSLMHQLRYVMLALLILRYNLLGPNYRLESKDLLWGACFIYFGYLLFLSWLERHGQAGFDSPRSKIIQVLTDISLISCFYAFRGDIKSDLYLFYLLPLLIAGRYLKNPAFVAALGLVLVALVAVSWTVDLPDSTTVWRPFPAPNRYLLILGIGLLRFFLGDFLRLIEHHKGTERASRTEGETPIITADIPTVQTIRDYISLNPPDDSITQVVQDITQRLMQLQNENEVDILYKEVIAIAHNYLRCETAAIFLLHNGQACRKKASQIDESEIPNEIYLPGVELTGEVLYRSFPNEKLLGRIVRQNKVQINKKTGSGYTETYKRLLPSHQVRHVLAIPIYGPTSVIGIIRVMNKLKQSGSNELDRHGFNARDVAIFSIIGNLVGPALHNNANVGRLQKLTAIGSQIETITTKNKLYQFIVEQSVALLDAEDCTIFAVDEGGQYIELAASKTIPAGEFDQEFRRKISSEAGSGLVAYVAATRKPLFFKGREYASHPAYRGFNKHYHYLPSQDCHSMMIVPLLDFTNQCLGVMRIINKQRGDELCGFDHEDYAVAKAMASQLANAVRRDFYYANREHYRKRQIKMQSNLLQLSQNLLSHLTQPKLALQEVVEGARPLLKADMVCILPFYEGYQGIEGFREELLCTSRRTGTQPLEAPRPNGMTWRVRNSSAEYVLVDLNQEPYLRRQFMREEGIVQVLGLKMTLQGQNLGVLYFYYRREYQPDKEDIRVAQFIASLAALVLHLTEFSAGKDRQELRLVQALEEHRNLLDGLQQSLDRLTSGLDEPATYAIRYLDSRVNPGVTPPEAQLDVIREAGRWIRQKLASIEHKLKVSELNLAEPIMEQCDLSELVEDVIFEYRDWANGRGINLVCASFNVIPYAEGDPRYLHAILVDLVSNAINSCQAGDEVALSYGCEDDKIFVDVRDTGKGMNWQERRQVETDLQAYHYQDTQIGRGLYYAGRFARLHLGRVISMGSELGQGSWFRLVLPQPASESFAFELIGACASG